MIRTKDGKLIFDNIKELNTEISRKIKPKIDEILKEYNNNLAVVKQQAISDTSLMMLPIIGTCLYEAYGFGEKRLEKFVEYFNKHLECIGDGVTTPEEYEEWCKEQGYKSLIVKAEE